MQPEDVQALLKSAFPSLWVGAHKIDEQEQKAACVYRRKGLPVKSVGNANGYGVLPVTVLIRGGGRAIEAVRQATEIYDYLSDLKSPTQFTHTGQDAPIALGTDEKGVYEFSVDADFYYEKEEN